jgi:hypothetical protein
MGTSSKRLATAVLLMSLLTILPLAVVQAQVNSSETIAFAGSDFNASVTTSLQQVSPAIYPDWSAVIFTEHQFNNVTSEYNIDFISASNNGTVGGDGLNPGSGAALTYTIGSGWFQYVRLQLGAAGNVHVYFMQNSSTDSVPIELFSCSSCWASNDTRAITIAGTGEDNINNGSEVFVQSNSGILSVGQIADNGTMTYWVNNFALPTQAGLAGPQGVTDVDAGCGSYYGTDGLHCHAVSVDAAGYVQIEFNPSGFSDTQSFTSFFQIILVVIPIIILIAVLGLILKVFKSFKL